MSKPDSRRVGSRAGAKATTRRAEMSSEDRAAMARQASEERQAKSQLVLFGSIGGGVLLLLIIIVAASSGGSGGAQARVEKKKVVAPPPPPPEAKPKPVNYVRNTGAIMFVCGGSDKHPDREVLIPQCPSCKAKNSFEVDGEAQGYRCTKCKAVHDNAAITCELCGRNARVTKLKKVLATSP
jgi:hypothetical protein